MLVILLNDVQNRNMIERLLHCIITKKTYVENEKKTTIKKNDRFAIKCKLEKNDWSVTCKTKTYFSSYGYGGLFFGKNYNFVTDFKFEKPTNFNNADEYIHHKHCSCNLVFLFFLRCKKVLLNLFLKGIFQYYQICK